MLRHPGHAKVTTSRPDTSVGGQYEIWISDGDLVRTYAARAQARHAATDPQPPARPRRSGPSRACPRSMSPSRRCRWRRCPTRSSTRPASARTSWRPAGARSPVSDRRSGREAILLSCDHPRTIELAGRPAGLTGSRSRSTARPGVILRLIETIGGVDHPRRRGHRARARRAAAADRLRLRLPDRDDDALLTRATPGSRRRD